MNPETQAETFAARARQFGLSGLVIDAEDFGNRIWLSPAGAEAARAYVQRLRSDMAGVPDLIVGLSSYRAIRFHRSFPFAEFMDGCDVAMPQVYWVARSGGDAVRNLQDSYEDYKAQLSVDVVSADRGCVWRRPRSERSTLVLVGTPDQITRFLAQAQGCACPQSHSAVGTCPAIPAIGCFLKRHQIPGLKEVLEGGYFSRAQQMPPGGP